MPRRRDRRRDPWLALAAGTALAALAGCTPILRADLPNGDHVVTTYVRLQGFDEARDDNLWAAEQTCHGGVVLIDEQSGADENGVYDRLTYGCVAPAVVETR